MLSCTRKANPRTLHPRSTIKNPTETVNHYHFPIKRTSRILTSSLKINNSPNSSGSTFSSTATRELVRLSELKGPISKLEHKYLRIDKILIKIYCLGFLIGVIATSSSNIPTNIGQQTKAPEDWSSTYKSTSASITSTRTSGGSTPLTTAVQSPSRSISKPERQKWNLTKIN